MEECPKYVTLSRTTQMDKVGRREEPVHKDLGEQSLRQPQIRRYGETSGCTGGTMGDVNSDPRTLGIQGQGI